MKDIILKKLAEKDRIIIAVDGRCASGKTTLAAKLADSFDCNVIHMDDFFLRPEQRTSERFDTPGENIDHERFLSEVLLPLKEDKSFFYRPFDCKTMSLGEPVDLPFKAINIIEGSYSCHPELFGYYDLRIFMTVDKAEQLKRLAERDPDKLEAFKSKWIPLEEKYFAAFDIEGRCDLVIRA